MISDASVFVIDDDPAVRDSLVIMLRSEGIRTRGFASGSEFFEHLPEDRLACVITDVRMPGLDGSEVVRRLADMQDREWPMIVITGHADVPTAVRMMKSGIVDFIEKPVDPARLVETVKGVLGGIGKLSRLREQRQAAESRLKGLTPRERQVFNALVEGLSNKEIARHLDISPRTVEIFRARVMDKMAAESLSALVRVALTLSTE